MLLISESVRVLARDSDRKGYSIVLNKKLCHQIHELAYEFEIVSAEDRTTCSRCSAKTLEGRNPSARETAPPAQEANQGFEAALDEAKHGQEL